MAEKELVFMEHDGNIDDLLSQMLLLTMDEKEIIGINVTPADCFIEPALESTYKLLQILDREEVAIGRSDFNGINAFPVEWRAKPMVANALPMLINLPPPPGPFSYPEATELLTKTLTGADREVSIIITGPCSNLVQAIRRTPSLKRKIGKIVWMAGAFRTDGNVQDYQHNGTAEWNVYWDPDSSKELFEMDLPLICVPLDVTNNVPVKRDFLTKLARQAERRLSNLAGQLWAMTVDTIPSYHYVYFMWDILATSYLAIPGAFKTEEIRAIVSNRPPNAGQTTLDRDGHQVTIVTDVDRDIFYKYILKQFNAD